MVTTVKNENSRSGNVMKKRRLFRSVGAVGVITTILCMGIASPASADSVDTLVSESVEGLREYQIFKHPGADLSYGKDFAPNFKATDIGITVIPEDRTEGRSLGIIAKQIQKEMPEYYDTVIVIEDGKDDRFSYYSERPSISDSFYNILGTKTPDAGTAIMDSQYEMFNEYVRYGGNADSKILEAKIKKDQASESTNGTDSDSVQKVDPLEEPTTPSTVISKSVAGLKSFRVFMHNGTDLSESAEVSGRMLDAAVGVAVVKQEHVEGKDLSEVSRFIREGVDNYHDTVIMVVDGDKDTFVVSSSLDGIDEKYKDILGDSVDDAGWTLLTNADKLVEERTTVVEAGIQKDKAEANSTFMKVAEIIGAVLGIAILLTVLIFGGSALLIANKVKRRKRKNSIEARIARSFEDLSDNFQAALVSLDKVADLHDTAIKTKTMSLSVDIRESINMMQKLFTAVSEKGVPNVRKMEAEVVYANRIEKLVTLLGETYYVDMANNPYAWRSSNKGMKNVNLALQEFQAQILENIQQLNEDNELEFQVALSTLLNRNTVELDDVYTDGTGSTRLNSSYEKFKSAFRNLR